MADLDRRQFLKQMGMIGGGVLLASSPWFSAFSDVKHTVGSTARIGVIGPGSRGQLLMSYLVKNQKVEIVAVCDVFQPSIDAALKMAPKWEPGKQPGSLSKGECVAWAR